MPSNLPDDEFEPKFGADCEGCKFVRRPRVCGGCDMGELFEELDPTGVDEMMRDRGAW